MPEPFRIVYDLTPTSTNQPLLEWLAPRGWCWGLEISEDTPVETIRALHERGLRTVLHHHAHPETCERQALARNQAVPDSEQIVPAFIETCGDDAYWLAFIEDDSSGVGFSNRLLRARPKTHAEAHALFDAYVAETMESARRYPGAIVWALGGFASSAHVLASHGADCVTIERANDDVDDLQTAIAFARGAARQYGCQWGIDLSLWWGVIYGCVETLPASYHKRIMYSAFCNGAQEIRFEGSHIHAQHAMPPIAPLLAELDAFGRFTRKFEAGIPDVPVAIMLPKDHGWITPPYWRTSSQVWNYARIPYRPGDRGIDGFFAAAFPGSAYAMDPFPAGAYEDDNPPASPFSLACVTEDFAPSPDDAWSAPPPIPFGRYINRQATREAFSQHTIDPAPYRPLGTSRWGDIIDVLTEDASLDTLSAYPVVVLLGPIELTDSLRIRLKEYVKVGGILVCAAGVVTPDDTDLCGFRFEPELRAGQAWQWHCDAPVHEAFRYCPVRETLDASCETLARTPHGAPLIVCRRSGHGKTYTCLIPWYEAAATPLAGAAQRLLDEIIEAVQPVMIEGLPVEWTSSRGDGWQQVMVANHDEAPWQGTVILRRPTDDYTRCQELVTSDAIEFSNTQRGIETLVEIPPYDVRILRWTK